MIYPRSWSKKKWSMIHLHDASINHGPYWTSRIPWGFPWFSLGCDASQAYTHCQIPTSAKHLMVVAWRMLGGASQLDRKPGRFGKSMKIQGFLVILPFKVSLTCREKSFLFGVEATSTRCHPAIPRRTIKKCGTWSQGSS